MGNYSTAGGRSGSVELAYVKLQLPRLTFQENFSN